MPILVDLVTTNSATQILSRTWIAVKPINHQLKIRKVGIVLRVTGNQLIHCFLLNVYFVERKSVTMIQSWRNFLHSNIEMQAGKVLNPEHLKLVTPNYFGYFRGKISLQEKPSTMHLVRTSLSQTTWNIRNQKKRLVNHFFLIQSKAELPLPTRMSSALLSTKSNLQLYRIARLCNWGIFNHSTFQSWKKMDFLASVSWWQLETVII